MGGQGSCCGVGVQAVSTWPQTCEWEGCTKPATRDAGVYGVPGAPGTAHYANMHLCTEHVRAARRTYGRLGLVGKLVPINHKHLLSLVKRLPQDWEPWGAVKEEDVGGYIDCSHGCRWYAELDGDLGGDWGVCCSPVSHRCGLLTFEHQAGYGCFEHGDDTDEDG